MTNQPFLSTIYLTPTLTYLTPGTTKWAVSLKLTPRSSFHHTHGHLNPYSLLLFPSTCEPLANDPWGKGRITHSNSEWFLIPCSQQLEGSPQLDRNSGVERYRKSNGPNTSHLQPRLLYILYQGSQSMPQPNMLRAHQTHNQHKRSSCSGLITKIKQYKKSRKLVLSPAPKPASLLEMFSNEDFLDEPWDIELKRTIIKSIKELKECEEDTT